MTDEADKAGKAEERFTEMTEANLAIARKVVLCAGLLVAALLFLFPHWRISISFVDGRPPVNYELGRAFIALKPLASAASRPLQSTTGAEPLIKARGVLLMGAAGSVIHINYARQFTEVALALLFTFGVMRALKKPTGDRKHNAEE
jgi:hypothetical protein